MTIVKRIRRLRSVRRHLSAAALAVFVMSFAWLFSGSATNPTGKITGYPNGVPDGVTQPHALPAFDVNALQRETSVDNLLLDSRAVAPDLDEAIWVEGEIVKLPKDPDKRRAAREQARANTAAKKTRASDVTYTPLRTAATEPVFVPRPDVPRREEASRFTPSQKDLENINIRLPDDFELPADVLRRITKETGHIDKAAEKEMASSVAQALIVNFGGIDQTTLTPPDCDIAVGPNHVVVVVNASYAVYDYCGTVLASGLLSSLTNTTLSLFDPKVVYDEWDNRWLICVLGRNTTTQESRVRLVVSAGADPPGVGSHWWYDYDWTNNGGWWADYDDIGFDPDAIYITTNDFNWNASPIFQRARIAVLDKAEVYNTLTSFRTEFFAMTNPADGTLAFSLRTAEMKSDPGEYYLVNSVSFGGSFLSWWEITGAPAAPVLNGFNIPVGLYDDPPNMAQGDGTFADCGDARLLVAKYYLSRVWTTHAQRVDWGGGNIRSAIEVYIINSVTRTIAQEGGPFGASTLYYCYPSVDMDPLDRGTVSFIRGGFTSFPSARFVDLTEGGAYSGSSLLQAGTAWKSDGANAGTNADPYRLGDYNGCDLARDGDNRTLWLYGHYASNSPAGSWDTHIGAVNYDGAGVLSVTPLGSPTLVSTGLVGGPFTPSGITYTLQNTGGARLPYDLAGVSNWNTASLTSGFLNPGASVNISVDINTVANGFGAGTFNDLYAFNECMSGASNSRQTQLTIGVDGSCPGSVVDLGNSGATNSAPDDNQERGIYVTALQDFQMCALAMKIDAALPQTLTARIYAANGTTRGALLATGTLTAVQSGEIFHYIPIAYTLKACQEYDITVQFNTTTSWPWWSESTITEPYDVAGVIRVRDGEASGNSGNTALPHFSIIGTAPVSQQVADLDPNQGTTLNSAGDDNQERGIFIKAEDTVHISSFGWNADLVPTQTITARAYEATGTTRGAMIAEGTLVVNSSGLQFHDVPLNVILEEGKEYDLAITFGTATAWPWWSELFLTEPYMVGPIRVVDAEILGNFGNTALPHYRVDYGQSVAGVPFDLGKQAGPFPPPNTTATSNSEYGAYVTSTISQEVYSLGWRADVPEGVQITARVYAATGTTRGALISEGTITSAGAGMRWHDVPVAAGLAAGVDYDLAIAFTTVNEWLWWPDTSDLPYDVHGVIRVRDGEQGSNAANTALLHLRMNGCNTIATGITDGGGTQAPRFTLGRPFPNPATSASTIPFSLDEAGPLSITVYDVLGRRVATVLKSSTRGAGPGVAYLDATNLAAGVYFVKMQAKHKAVSRKITIVR